MSATYKCELVAAWAAFDNVCVLLKGTEVLIDNKWMGAADLDEGVIYTDQWIEHEVPGIDLQYSESLVVRGTLVFYNFELDYDALLNTTLYIEVEDIELPIVGSEFAPERFNFAPVKGRIVHRLGEILSVGTEAPLPIIPVPSLPKLPVSYAVH